MKESSIELDRELSRYLILKLGLKWHDGVILEREGKRDWYGCQCGYVAKEPQAFPKLDVEVHIGQERIDPLDTKDLYEKIIPALGKRGRFAFCNWLKDKYLESDRDMLDVDFRMYDTTLLKPRLLVQALLDYLRKNKTDNLVSIAKRTLELESKETPNEG